MDKFKFLSNTSSNYLHIHTFPIFALIATVATSVVKEILLMC